MDSKRLFLYRFLIYCQTCSQGFSSGAYEEYVRENIPWNHILIAYIGNKYDDGKTDLYNRIRANGVGIMVSTVSSIDRITDDDQREAAYQMLLSKDIQVLETDFPMDIYKHIN